MKTFEYKNFLLCKDLFNCKNCKFYDPYIIVVNRGKINIVCKNIPYKHVHVNFIRLTDFKVCSYFIPRYTLSELNFDS